MVTIIKENIKKIFSKLYYMSGRYRTIHKGKVVILAYHRILPKQKVHNEFVLRGMYVEKKIFEQQIIFLKENYTIISLERFLQIDETGESNNKKKYCVITFDDGWRDNFDYAFPILKKYNIPATIFLSTSFINTNKIFWPERLITVLEKIKSEPNGDIKNKVFTLFEQFGFDSNLTISFLERSCKEQQLTILYKIITQFKQKNNKKVIKFLESSEKTLSLLNQRERKMLSWEEIKNMEIDNISFGPHGETHRILTTLKKDEVLTEIMESKSAIDNHGVKCLPVFCYPNGNFNTEIKKMLHHAGFKAAMSTIYGSTTLGKKDKYSYERIIVHQNNSKTLSHFVYSLSKTA